MLFALSIPTSDARNTPVGIANTVLVRNIRFASENTAQK
jgi:hypothetical protein